MSRISRLITTGLALGLLAGLAAPAAHAAAPACAKKPSGTVLETSGGGVLWHKAGSLYVCTAYYGDPPVTKKIGRWTKGSKVSFDGSTAVWTTRVVIDDFPEERIWAADGPYGVWLKGVRPALGFAGALDTEVGSVKAYGDAVGWVTTQGTVMMGVRSPSSEPEGVGEGTPGAAAPVVPGITDVPGASIDEMITQPQGLSKSLKPSGRRLYVGRWTALAGKKLSDSLRVGSGGNGESDECGGTNEYVLTVKPVAGQDRVGARWNSDWSSTSSVCS